MTHELLLARADDHQPVLRQGLDLRAHPMPPPPRPVELPERLWDAGGERDVLSRQRWGLVVPEGPAGEKLLRLVEPLRQRRQESQGGERVHVYCVPPDMDGPRAMRWKKQVFRKNPAAEEERPRYLLILGDLHMVSLELQQILSTDAFVGRLAFPQDEGYASYVDKVLHWERAPARRGEPRLLLYTARDGSDATEHGHQWLMEPILEASRRRQRLGRFPKAELLDLGGEGLVSMEQLRARVEEHGPGVLLSLSHGLGTPQEGWGSPAEQRERQGALVLPGSRCLTGAELASRPFLPGGVWFCIACFSAGTPARSMYIHWLQQLREAVPEAARVLDGVLPREGDQPFIAALPQAALANPDGPLAVMGHVDLAWTSSFSDQGRGAHACFLRVLRALVEGRRVGNALGTLLEFFNEVNAELTALYNRDQSVRGEGRSSLIEPVEWADLWMLRQDLAGYVLLGDPAVQLPLSSSKVET